MPTALAFRLSTYLTLGLACVALGYSEWDLLPEVSVFTVTAVALLVGSFFAEGRYELDLGTANRVGFVLGALAVAWVGWQFVRPSGGLIYVLPWPASLLPYLGPLLMILMPAKLFRPKHAGDWWAMHGIALVAVGLGSAITDDATFGLLFGLYAACAAWSVALLAVRERAGAVPADPAGDPPGTPVGPPRPALYLTRAAGWAAGAVAVALPAFFLSPPYSGNKWQLTGKSQMETGLAAESVVDLNRTGELQVNREVALVVRAAWPDGSPMTDLPAGQRWRAALLTEYENGQWKVSQRANLFRSNQVLPRGEAGLPDLGPGQYTLSFDPTPKLSRPVLADPVMYRPGHSSPVASVRPTRLVPWAHLPDGSLVPLSATEGRVSPYRQVNRPPDEPGLGPPYELAPRGDEGIAVLRGVRTVPRLREWATAKLAEFVAAGQLPAAVLDRAEVDRITRATVVAQQDYERVGKAFQSYFANPQEFAYDLRLTRQDKTLDPTEDFVLNTRTGHCERFASALALSLRSVGVPAALALGFLGWEEEEPGRYVIRQEHAHAWVAILVPRPVPPGFPPPRMGADGEPVIDGPPPAPPAEAWHWLTLDPTPAGRTDAADATAGGTWIDQVRANSWWFYNQFIIGYSEERRAEAVANLKSHLRRNWPWYAGGAVGLLALGGVGVAVRRWPARVRVVPPASPVPWYDATVAALAAAGHSPKPGQTPKEHAAAAAAALAADPATADLAAVPETAAEALYRLRYAGRPLSEKEIDGLTAAAAALAARIGPARSPEVSRG